MEPLYPVGRNEKWCSHYGSLEVPQKIIKRTIIRLRNHSFEFMSKGDKMRMSIATLYTTTKIEKLPSVHGQINH